MLGVMMALLFGFLGWLLLYRPIVGASHALDTALEVAAERKVSITAKVSELKAVAARPQSVASRGPLGAIIAESAAQADLTHDPVAVKSNGRISITLTSARTSQVLSWLAGLEAQGIVIETVTMAPTQPAGSVTVQAVLFRLDAGG